MEQAIEQLLTLARQASGGPDGEAAARAEAEAGPLLRRAVPLLETARHLEALCHRYLSEPGAETAPDKLIADFAALLRAELELIDPDYRRKRPRLRKPAA